MRTAIETFSLTKYYGKVRGAEDVNLKVHVGEVFGFLGPNGAGKSTTIRMLLDFIRPTRGTSTILGLDSRDRSIEIRKRVGYVPSNLAMYDKMTGWEMLGFLAALRGIEGLGDAPKVSERLGLDLDRTIRSLSSGNRQKIGLAQAFMHRPELLVLDEPTNSLDPLIRQEFYSMVGELREQQRTVFLSSHVLSEVERIADRVAIIRNGRIATVGSVTELKLRTLRHIEFRFATPVGAAIFREIPAVRYATEHNSGTVVEVTITGSVDTVLRVAAQHEILDIVSRNSDLEEVFLAYFSEEGGDKKASCAP